MNPDDVCDQTTFAKGLDRLRRQRGLRYADFNARQGVGRSTASDMCRGRVLPNEESLEAFLRMCGVSGAGASSWLAARRRLVAGRTTSPTRSTSPPRSDQPATVRWAG